MIHEQFIPGRWQDDVDVNDFLSLNKKPFLKDPSFLKQSSNDARLLHAKIQKPLFVTPQYASLKEASPEYIDRKLEKIPGFYSQRKLGYTDTIEDISKVYGFTEKPSREKIRKTPSQLLSEVITSETLKLIKIGVFQELPLTSSPSYLHPDARRVALYGTKRLIEDKRYQLKLLEKHLQTHDWIEQRITIQQTIESLKQLEKFSKLYGVDISEPAKNAKEAITFVYLTLLACCIDNPGIPFALTQVISFLDVYIEHSLVEGELTETEAQAYIDEFAIKINALPWTHEEHIMETITSKTVTKTTYRLLQSMEQFSLNRILLHVEWIPSLHKEMRQRILKLTSSGISVRLYNNPKLKEAEQVAIYDKGQMGVIGEEAYLFAGKCDLEKILYLSLNGGKDIPSNSNLKPITQPMRKEKLEYEDVYTRFKDYLSYILSVYVELANMILYLNETGRNHPLRNALMDNMVLFKVQFGFFNVESIALLLTAIQNDQYIFTKDSKGWILKMESKPNVTVEYDVFLADLITLLEQELEKIPMYNKGKAQIRFEGVTESWQIPFGFTNATMAQVKSNLNELTTTDAHQMEIHVLNRK